MNQEPETNHKNQEEQFKSQKENPMNKKISVPLAFGIIILFALVVGFLILHYLKISIGILEMEVKKNVKEVEEKLVKKNLRSIPKKHGMPTYIVFSPDNKRFAYKVRKENQSFFVLDGVEQKKYDDVADFFIFSPDSQRFAYIAKEGIKQFVVFNSIELGRYDQVYNLSFSPDGKYLIYNVRDDIDTYFVIKEVEELEKWENFYNKYKDNFEKQGTRFETKVIDKRTILFSPNKKLVSFIVRGYEFSKPYIVDVETGVNIIEKENIWFNDPRKSLFWFLDEEMFIIKSKLNDFSGEGKEAIFICQGEDYKLKEIYSLTNQEYLFEGLNIENIKFFDDKIFFSVVKYYYPYYYPEIQKQYYYDIKTQKLSVIFPKESH